MMEHYTCKRMVESWEDSALVMMGEGSGPQQAAESFAQERPGHFTEDLEPQERTVQVQRGNKYWSYLISVEMMPLCSTTETTGMDLDAIDAEL